MGLRQELAEIMRDTDKKIQLIAGGDLASLQPRWSDVPADDRMAILLLLVMANNRGLTAVVDHLEPSA